jgi:hypothetical protein
MRLGVQVSVTTKNKPNNAPAAPGAENYLRPGGVDTYRRPGGTDVYKRPA